MLCIDIQDRLWDLNPIEEPEELRVHLAGCATCSGARGEIERIRKTLRVEVPPADAMMAGVMSRMARPKPAGWISKGRVAAAVFVGLAGGLLLGRPAPPARPSQPDSPLHRLVSRFENDPGFEETLIFALNETLRRQSELASAEAAPMKEVLP